jgi:hypothetical protein
VWDATFITVRLTPSLSPPYTNDHCSLDTSLHYKRESETSSSHQHPPLHPIQLNYVRAHCDTKRSAATLPYPSTSTPQPQHAFPKPNTLPLLIHIVESTRGAHIFIISAVRAAVLGAITPGNTMFGPRGATLFLDGV